MFDSLHPHWGDATTQTFTDPLLSGSLVEPGYVEGHNAGALNLEAAAYVLDGTFYAGVMAGDRQRASGQRPSGNALNSAAMPQAGTLTLSGRNDLDIAAVVAPLAADFGAGDALPADAMQTTRLSATKLTDANFGSIAANFGGHLELAAMRIWRSRPPGSISLSGGSVDIEGSLVARSGSISVESTAHISGDLPGAANTAYVATGTDRTHLFDLVIGANALLDASGLWVNDDGASPAGLIGGAFIAGGSVTLKTDARSATCQTPACAAFPGLGPDVPANVDITGDIVLSEGALIDVTSGGAHHRPRRVAAGCQWPRRRQGRRCFAPDLCRRIFPWRRSPAADGGTAGGDHPPDGIGRQRRRQCGGARPDDTRNRICPGRGPCRCRLRLSPSAGRRHLPEASRCRPISSPAILLAPTI